MKLEIIIKEHKIIFLNTKERTFYIDLRRIFYLWIGPEPFKPEGPIEFEIGVATWFWSSNHGICRF